MMKELRNIQEPKDNERIKIAHRNLDEMFAMGVKARNRFIPTIPNFNAELARNNLKAWEELVLHEVDVAGVKIALRSRFRTFDKYEPDFHRNEGKTPEQEKLESIWSEKLVRLRDIIDSLE